MQRHISVNLGNLILSLSEAMDLASPQLTQHQQRTAFIVWEMAKTAHLSNERLEKVFIAALVHDIGTFSLEEKISLRTHEVEDIENHCIRGEILLSTIPWLKDAAKIVRSHHKEWQYWKESIENSIVLESQILFLADYLERKIKRETYILHQHEDIISQIKSLTGAYVHLRIVDLFLEVAYREEFWLDIVSPRLYSILLNEG